MSSASYVFVGLKQYNVQKGHTAHDKKERGHMTPVPTWEYVYRPMVGHATAQAMTDNLYTKWFVSVGLIQITFNSPWQL